MEIIEINSELSLTPYYKTDSDSLVKYLNDGTVSENMLAFPHPYTRADSELFLDKIIKDQDSGMNGFKAIRMNGELIGGAGFKSIGGQNSHKDEIAYWLAAPFRNKGITTTVVKKICSYGFKEKGLERIEAITFDFNKISPKVLLNVGFKFEGTLRKYYKKNEKIIDGKLYSLIKEDLITL